MAFMLDRIPLRYLMFFMIGVSLMVTEIIKEFDHDVWSTLVAARDVEFIPYVPGAYSCPYHYSNDSRTARDKTEVAFRFEWGFLNSMEQFLYWVGVICELPSGIWADLYGGHRLMFWSLGLSSILRLLTPVSVSLGEDAYVLTRLLSQVCVSPAWPASLSMLAHWAESQERTVATAVMLSFARVARIAPEILRWDIQLYCAGALGLLASALWFATGRRWHDARLRSPAQAGPAKRVPLAKMVTAPPLLRLYLLAVAAEGTSSTGAKVLWRYLKQALTWTSPFVGITRFLGTFLLFGGTVYAYVFAGVASDYLVSARLIGLPTARRIFLGASCVGAAVSISLVAAARCNTYFAIGCIVAYRFFCACQRTMLVSAVLDTAPCLAGTLISLGGISTSLSARAIDRVVRRITGSWRTRGNVLVWSGVFLMFGILNLVPAVPYFVLGPFAELPWARRPSLDAQPNTFKAWLLHLILSMAGIILFCVFAVVVSIWL